MTEQPKRGLGRPRKHETRSQRQRDYEARSGYETSEDRKAYKREWARQYRQKKKGNEKSRE